MRISNSMWLIVVVALAAVVAWGAPQEKGDVQKETAEAAPPSAEASENEPEVEDISEAEVAMARIKLSHTTIEGRIVHEDERLLRIESIAGSIIGYDKRSVKEVTRFAIPAHVYHERLGDHYAEQLWDFEDDLNDFVRARKAYQRSLNIASTAAVQQKLEHLAQEREKWQEEVLQRHEIQEALDRAETARLEKERAEQTLKEQQQLYGLLEKQTRLISKLEDRLKALERGNYLIRLRLDDLKDDIDDLEDDFRRRWYRYRVYSRRVEIH